MVKKRNLLKRKAFTLIELIFAIVIIAISVISLPMMVSTTSKGIEANIIQEAIFASAATLNESTTYYWDEHSLDDVNTSGGYSRVVNTATGGCLGTTPNKRVGHINRRCLDDNTTIPFTGTVFEDSINLAAHSASSIFTATSSPSAATYKSQYDSIVDVANCSGGGCVQFGEEVDNPNLKEVKITIVPTGDTEELVVLRAYSANIGEVAPKSRIY